MATETTRERDATPAGPNTMVIFGAGGDLTMRKLVPALYHLARQKLLSDAFAIVGFGGRDYDDDPSRASFRSGESPLGTNYRRTGRSMAPTRS